MPTWRNFRETENLRSLHDVHEKASYAIQSQYSASPRMLAIMEGFQKHIDLTADTDTFYDEIFNILTARGPGLDLWGNILGISRIIQSIETEASLTLSDDYYRLLLLYKALANISSSDAASLNELLSQLVDTGIGGFDMPAYVIEVDTMVIRWVFEDSLDETQYAVFYAAGVLARGAGVGWEIYALNPKKVFGFDGSGMHPFNQTPFAPDNALTVGN